MRVWRRFEDWINVVLGAYLFVVPFFVAAEVASAWNACIVGFLVFSVSLYALARPASRGAEWTNVVLGMWMILAPFALGFAALAGTMAVNAYVVGVLVVVFAGIALYRMGHPGTAAPHRTR